MNLRTVAITLVAGALLGAGGTVGMQALIGGGDSESLPPVEKLGESWLQGVDINDLAGQGLYLSQPPPDYIPKISGGAAKRVAGEEYSKASARQILLAHLQTDALGGFDGQVFVVNFDPVDLPALCPGSHTIFAIAFVDSNSGAYLYAQSAECPSSTPACRRGIQLPTPG
jgi:hypothetical protein